MVGLYGYAYGKTKARVYVVPRTGFRAPDLGQLVVRAKYLVKGMTFDQVFDNLYRALNNEFEETEFMGETHGNAMTFTRTLVKLKKAPSRFGLRSGREHSEESYQKEYFLKLAKTRSGIPMKVVIVGNNVEGGIELDLTLMPVLYNKIAQLGWPQCTDQDIQEAQHECTTFAGQLKGMMGAAELEKPSIHPPTLVTDVRRRLIALGMSKQAELLQEAEAKITAGVPSDGVKNCRSAVEQVSASLMTRVGLGQTDSFKHDLDRLVSNRRLDPWIADSIHRFYYALVSEDAHDKYRPGYDEGKYILAMTENTIEFLLKRIA